MILLVLLRFLLPCNTRAHVALTFPPARFPPLDFLDNARTISPCGVPKPTSPHYTDLYINQSYNFTWRLQYPHQGGYRISVINEAGDIIEQLAPVQGKEFVGNEDQTSQYATVQLTRPCTRCVILLERQALEWGKAYGFRSCSDVNIVDGIAKDDERCSLHGHYENGRCKCSHSFSGPLCQYKDHCSTDEDCLNDGKCVKQSDTMVPRTCYCAFGYFGQNCDRTFDGNPDEDKCFNYNYPKDERSFSKYGIFDEKCFKKTELNADDFIYSRVIRDELEVILDYKGTSWISMGWRPMDIDRSCRLFPDLENTRQKRSTGQASHPDTMQHINSSTERVVIAIPEIDLDMMPVPMPKLPKNNGLLKTALLAPLHPMDCTDIVIGSVRDGRSRINDMYTRDRSTPLYDTWLDGEESFSAAFGIEIDGRTVIMFRRRIAEIEPSDHPLGPGKIFVIYAKGQTTDYNSHAVKSALEEGRIKDHDFYKSDQVKYHGNKNRGVYPIEFVSVQEQPPSIRPPPRFRQREPPQQASEVANQKSGGPVLVESTQSSSKSLPSNLSSTAPGNRAGEVLKTVANTVRKSESAATNRATSFSKPMRQSEPEQNLHEIDYIYFDNGSSQMGYHQIRSSFLLFLLFSIVFSCYYF